MKPICRFVLKRDEVKASVTESKPDTFRLQAKEDFLEDKRSQLREWAIEAGKSVSDAEDVFNAHLAEYELEFESQFY